MFLVRYYILPKSPSLHGKSMRELSTADAKFQSRKNELRSGLKFFAQSYMASTALFRLEGLELRMVHVFSSYE